MFFLLAFEVEAEVEVEGGSAVGNLFSLSQTIHHSASPIHYTIPFTLPPFTPSTIHHPPSQTIQASPIHHHPFTIHHHPFTIHHHPFTIHHHPSPIEHSPYTIHPLKAPPNTRLFSCFL
jgi:hypothetical protein